MTQGAFSNKKDPFYASLPPSATRPCTPAPSRPHPDERREKSNQGETGWVATEPRPGSSRSHCSPGSLPHGWIVGERGNKGRERRLDCSRLYSSHFMPLLIVKKVRYPEGKNELARGGGGVNIGGESLEKPLKEPKLVLGLNFGRTVT